MNWDEKRGTGRTLGQPPEGYSDHGPGELGMHDSGSSQRNWRDSEAIGEPGREVPGSVARQSATAGSVHARAGEAITPAGRGANEEIFRQLAEHVREAFWLSSPDRGEMFYVSPGYERLFGRSCASLYDNPRSFLESVHAEDRERVEDSMRLQMQGLAADVEYRILRPDGELRWVSARAFPIYDDSGALTHLAGRAEDITERRLAEELAQKRHGELAHMCRLQTMGAMGSALAHEVNQPLAAITNYAVGCQHRLRAGNMDAEALAGALEQIVSQARRAGDIVRGLRDFVRKHERSTVMIEVSGLIDEVVLLAEPEARSYGVTLRKRLQAELPEVLGDRIQIQQVLLNLVRNALEAFDERPAGERVVMIEAVTSGAGEVELCVSDNGPGLGGADLEELFAPFQTSKPGGLGMGLSISRSIAEAHGGRLWAQCEPNAGSGGAAFHFTLPTTQGESRG